MGVYYYDQWVRVEGPTVPLNNNVKYQNKPSGISEVFYSEPEIQLYNAETTSLGVVYKVIKLSKYYPYTDFADMCNNWNTIVAGINAEDMTVDLSSPDNAGQAYFTAQPFCLSESSVILYGSSDKSEYQYATVVLVDPDASDIIVAITAKWLGSSVPVGSAFDEQYMELIAIYENGQTAKIRDQYSIEPANKIITVDNGMNQFKITYPDPQPNSTKVFETYLAIPGVRALTGITGQYIKETGDVLFEYHEIKKANLRCQASFTDYDGNTSSVTITDFSCPNGLLPKSPSADDLALDPNLDPDKKYVKITYKNYYYFVPIDVDIINSSRLVAVYTGSPIEVGDELHIQNADGHMNVQVSVYYYGQPANAQTVSGYASHEDLDDDVILNKVQFNPTRIDHEGMNYIVVSYEDVTGRTISTTMFVAGVSPSIDIDHIEAEYVGPEIYVGKAFSMENVICKIWYDDGSSVETKNILCHSCIVNAVGDNVFEIVYQENNKDYIDTITVIGLEAESTTKNNYSPFMLDNWYPEAVILNNRFRGPAEHYKTRNFNLTMVENLNVLNDLFRDVEKEYNKMVERVEGGNGVKGRLFSQTREEEERIERYPLDNRLTHGRYPYP